MSKQRWSSQLGIIMAVAGSAIGLGNFLRFPSQVALHGGGAFLIPYFIALFLFGIPLMWIEWTIGRFGGGLGHSTAPGMFHTMSNKNAFIKYFGVIGIFGPLVIFMYYTYIESWLLGYCFYSLTDKYAAACGTEAGLKAFLSGYQGMQSNEYFCGLGPAYIFFLITFILNVTIVYFGIRGGIEKICTWGMPVLFLLAIVLIVRVFTLGTPDPAKPDQNILNGLGFMWNPKWEALKEPKVWLAAAGQIFFTLSIGIGVILTYASYLTKDDDVALSGLTAASTNEIAEVILGGSIVIPAAFLFLGQMGTKEAAQGGMFNLGFIIMPLVLHKMAFSSLLSFIWFGLLFIAGITSSISLAQPVIAFLEDEYKYTRRKAVSIFFVVAFLLCQPAIFLLGKGAVDELDFWGGTFCLVLFGTVETILFGWIFGLDKAWIELHAGSDITIPRIYRFIIKYITPVFLLILLAAWGIKDGWPILTMKNVSADNWRYIFGVRILLLTLFFALAFLVFYSEKRIKTGEKQ